MSTEVEPTGGGTVVDAHRASYQALDDLAAACTVLSRMLLAAPDQPALDATREPGMLTAWPLPPSEPTMRGLAAWRRSAQAAEDERVVRRDHRRLFIGPGPLLAPPYESVHRSVDRLVFEAQTLQVRAVYARHGLAAPSLDREPDDHIGLELDLLATLSLRAMDALDADDAASARELQAAQRSFLDEHLLRWAPGLLRTIEDRADTDFYRGVGALGTGLVDHLEQWAAEPGDGV